MILFYFSNLSNYNNIKNINSSWPEEEERETGMDNIVHQHVDC